MARRRLPEADCGPRGALALLALALCAPGARGRALEWYSAVVTTEYRDPRTNQTVRSVAESGRFGDSSPKESALGLVGVPRAADHDPEGCSPDTRFFVPLPGGGGTAPWVALVARGGCNFKDKVLVAARRNASAVVVYNEERHGNLTAPMSHAGKPGPGAAEGGVFLPCGHGRRPSRPPLDPCGVGSIFRKRGGVGGGATLIAPGGQELCTGFAPSAPWGAVRKKASLDQIRIWP